MTGTGRRFILEDGDKSSMLAANEASMEAGGGGAVVEVELEAAGEVEDAKVGDGMTSTRAMPNDAMRPPDSDRRVEGSESKEDDWCRQKGGLEFAATVYGGRGSVNEKVS